MTLLSRASRLAMLVALLLPPAAATAEGAAGPNVKAGDLVIEHPWARATPNGAQVAGGYMTITNHGNTADMLTGGSAEVAAKFELHEMTMENGVMKMRPSGPLTIPPGGSVTLSPGGHHIMLTGLKHGLRTGDTVEGTLTFAHAGTVPVRFGVEGIGAREPVPPGGHDPQSGHDTSGMGHAMPGMKM